MVKEIENIDNIEHDKYNYALVHRYDKFEIYKSEDIKKAIYDNDLLIEARLFNNDEEICITPQKTTETNKYNILYKDSSNSDTIKEQHILSNNKIKNLPNYKNCNKGLGSYVLEFEKIIDYCDGQAYIKETRLIDIKYKKYSQAMEV